MNNRRIKYRGNSASSLRLAAIILFWCCLPISGQDVKVLPPSPEILPPVPTVGAPAANQPRFEVPQEEVLAPVVQPAAPIGAYPVSQITERPVARPSDQGAVIAFPSRVEGSGSLAPAAVSHTGAPVQVLFPTGDARLMPEFRTNAQALFTLDTLLAAIDMARLDSLLIISQSSPEGDFAQNQDLSQRRGDALRRYVFSAYPDFLTRVRVRATGEAWADLRDAVVADTRLTPASRSRILAVIDSDLEPDAKEARLNALPDYSYLLHNIFPLLRRSSVEVILRQGAPAATVPAETVPAETVPAQTVVTEIVPSETVPGWPVLPLNIPVEDLRIDVPRSTMVLDEIVLRVRPLRMPAREITGRRMILAAKTNLLYDAVTMLNAEIEVPFLYRFSLLWEDVFPWWETGNKYCLQHWEMGPELRVWLRSWRADSMNKMTGWFVGGYGMSSRYDFQFDTKIDYQGEYWSAGLCAGYVMPIRKGWLHDALNARLEFELAAGYLQTAYRHYLPTDSYDMLIRDKYNAGVATYIGPTKAKVSLVVPISVKTNKRK